MACRFTSGTDPHTGRRLRAEVLDSVPDAALIVAYCWDTVPEHLIDSCHMGEDEAMAVAEDILARATYFAALHPELRHVLSAPFLEEVATYDPRDALITTKAAVSVVVRSSELEAAHARQQVKAADIKVLTTAAATPLSHLLAATHLAAIQPPGRNVFVGLGKEYPRAWACLAALAEAFDREGARVGYNLPDAPIPAMPLAHEHTDAKDSIQHKGAVITSAIDPGFDAKLIEAITMATHHHMPLFVPTLSRISRNLDKLLRVIELLLAHGASILTTNYLLRVNEVWLRKRHFVIPDNYEPLAGLRETTGLSGVHRNVAEQVLGELEERGDN